MDKKELQIWFRNKFNNCYQIIKEDKPKNIYMFYDPQFIRQKKLSRILGEEIVYPEEPNGICLFEQDYKNGYLWMDYDEITLFFLKNYSPKWIEIKELIHGWLKEDTKLKVLTPQGNLIDGVVVAERRYKIEGTYTNNASTATSGLAERRYKIEGTPNILKLSAAKLLKEDTKLKVLTPYPQRISEAEPLKEDTKLKVLTPKPITLFSQTS